MNTQTTFRYNKPSNPTKKKEPKKEFSLEGNLNAFPTLTRSDNNNNKQSILSFANATKSEKKEITIENVSDAIPGWIHIRIDNNNGKIQYKEGKPTNRYPCSDDNFDFKLGSAMFKNRLAREQYERNNDIARLGDFSEYYGEKTLYEMYADEEQSLLSEKYDDSLSSSDQSDYDDYHDNNNNKFENTN
jgi:hypothetical protein